MSTVDERIVSMKIDNKQLLSGAKTSQSALSSLNRSVNGMANTKGMQALGGAAEGVGHKLSLLRTAALGAAAGVGFQLVNAGIRLVKSFTIDPIIAGFHSYEETINATKTIMANTGASAKTTKKYLGDLQQYANKTVYSFSEMAKNIGTFTAAGVKLPTATAAIKGVANMAALSGSTSQQASSAMYQLSQALAAGTIHLQDWNSVVNAGMGGKKLQGALVTTADALGKTVNIGTKAAPKFVKLSDAVGKYGKTFREVISDGGVDSKIMATTLKIMSGDMTKAQIKAMGFSKSQTQMMYKLAQTAKHSATDIKTYSQLTQALKEEVATAWGAVFKTIFGGLGSATKMFSAIHIVAENAFTQPVYALNRLLEGWAKLGGRTAVIKGFINIWKSLSSIFHAVAVAWKAVFPPSSGKMLADISKGFEDLTKHLIPSKAALKDITDIFKAVFTILGAGAMVVGGVFKYFYSLIALFVDNGGGAAQGILGIVAAVARLITGFTQMTNLSGRIQDLFNKIIDSRAKILTPIIKTVSAILKALDPLLHGNTSGFMDQFKKSFANLAPLGKVISGIGLSLTTTFESIQAKGTGTISKIAGYFAKAAWAVKGFGDSLSNVFHSFSGGAAKTAQNSTMMLASATTSASDGGQKFITVMKAVGQWVLNAAVAIAKGIGHIWDAVKNWASGIDQFDLLTAFSYVLNGAVLVMVYKFIKTLKGYFEGFKNIGESFTQLTATLKTMQQGVRAKIILNIAIAVGVLAASLWLLSRLPTKKLALGMAAISTLLAEVVGTMALLGKGTLGSFTQKNILGMAASLTLIAFAMIELATAVAMFGNMDVSTLAKGITAMAVSLGVMVAASLGLSKVEGSIIRAAAAMVVMSFAMETLAGVILTFSMINWDTFASGMVKMGVALGVIVIAMNAMPTDKMLGNSVGMIAISAAMVVLAGAIAIFGNMSLETIAKGLGTMAAALLILVVATNAMTEALPGAAAMLVVSASVVALAVGLRILGGMDIGAIAKSLSVLTVALAIFLLAGAGAEVVAVGLLALGAAVALIGVGMLAAGVGMAAFGAGLSVLVALGTGAFGVIMTAIQAFLAMLPTIAVQVAVAFVAFMHEMAVAAPKIANSFVKIITTMINAAQRLLPKIVHLVNLFIGQMLSVVDKNAPKFGHTLTIMINTGIRVLSNAVPKMINLGLKIIDSFISAVNKHVPHIVNSATDIVVKFINGVARYVGRFIAAGTNVIVKFIVGIGNAAGRLVDAAGKTILKFLDALNSAVNRYEPQIIAAAARIGVSIGRGVISGIAGMASQAASAAFNLAKGAISALHNGIKNPPFPSREGIAIGYSLAYGFASGITSGSPESLSAAATMAQNTIDAAKTTLDSHSPSKVFQQIGLDVGRGFINGLVASVMSVRAAGTILALAAVDSVSKAVTGAQIQADAQAAKASAYRDAAAIASAKARAKGLSKARKDSLNAQAKHLSDLAKAADKISKAEHDSIARAAKSAADTHAFKAANAQGKTDILQKRAEDAAKAASDNRNLAIKLAKEADLVRQLDAKRAKDLDKQASAALKKAETSAASARKNASEAAVWAATAAVRSVADVQKQIDADKADVALQAKLGAMSDREKADYYTQQAADQQAISDAKYAAAEALLAKAQTEAKSNADQAKKDVATAQQDVTDAEAAKQAADEASQNASQLLGQSSQQGGLKMPDTTIASALVYGAQNMFDAYAKALSATQAEATKDHPPSVQLTQNNYSPVALSPSEIYRQSRNLLSNTERKLTGALP